MRKAKILIVDDDSKISGLMRLLLEKAGGYEVQEENRPYAAMTTAKAFRPDLFILDVNMPGKDGGEVAREFEADSVFSATPVVFVTSLVPRREAGAEQLVRGGKLFLSKPVDPHALLRAVRERVSSVTA